MNSKTFSQRFNRELSLIGFPDDLNEKTKAVAKVFGVSRHLANAMLFGYSLPSIEQLDKIAVLPVSWGEIPNRSGELIVQNH